MKKATLTIGLFALMMVLTSFTAPETTTSLIANNAIITSIEGGAGTQDSGGNKKVDFNGNQTIKSSTNKIVAIHGAGTQDSGGNKKVD